MASAASRKRRFLGFSHFENPYEPLLYGLLSYAERDKQTFRPSHRDPAHFLCATGDPLRADIQISIQISGDVTKFPILGQQPGYPKIRR